MPPSREHAMSKARSKVGKSGKVTTDSGGTFKLKKRVVQPAYTKGMKVRVTPQMAREAALKIIQAKAGAAKPSN